MFLYAFVIVSLIVCKGVTLCACVFHILIDGKRSDHRFKTDKTLFSKRVHVSDASFYQIKKHNSLKLNKISTFLKFEKVRIFFLYALNEKASVNFTHNF